MEKLISLPGVCIESIAQKRFSILSPIFAGILNSHHIALAVMACPISYHQYYCQIGMAVVVVIANCDNEGVMLSILFSPSAVAGWLADWLLSSS